MRQAISIAGSLSILVSRSTGEHARTLAGLDRLDTVMDDREPVQVHFAPNLLSVSVSYFLGLFGPSIRRLGAAGFRRRYRLTGFPVAGTCECAIREVLGTPAAH